MKDDYCLCAKCGHDYDYHVNYELEKGCRCLCCYESFPCPCKYGEDPEDNEGPRCTCEKWVDPRNKDNE